MAADDQLYREFRAKVVECDVPSGSMLSREWIEHAYFRNSFAAPLSRRDLGATDLFLAIFAHHPLWMKLLLIVRNKAASVVGLDAPTTSEILNADIKIDMSSGRISGRGPSSRSAKMKSLPGETTSTWIQGIGAEAARRRRK